jgi:2-deoxy-D-gluconate 3-dehydrogenase
MTNPFSLAGRHALVTNGASGIGQAIAHALAQAGADVTVAGPAEPVAAAQLDAAERARGPIDILVNNVDASGVTDDWCAVFEANLDAPWRLAQAAAQRMVTRGGGKIVNVAPPVAFRRGPAHAASQHALVGLTKALANEFAPRSVNVNALAPTDLATGHPEPLGNACVFLCSRAADNIHGHVLALDGSAARAETSSTPVQRT